MNLVLCEIHQSQQDNCFVTPLTGGLQHNYFHKVGK
jgi:hypothetical protein